MGLHIGFNSSVHNSLTPFPLLCAWKVCSKLPGVPMHNACSLLLSHLLSLSQALLSFSRVQQGELHCNAEAGWENLHPYCSTFLFPFNALKTQLLYEREAAWSAGPGFALLGVCEARLSSRRVLSRCMCMYSDCPCLGHFWCKPRPPDVGPMLMAVACRDNQNGPNKGLVFKVV